MTSKNAVKMASACEKIMLQDFPTPCAAQTTGLLKIAMERFN